LTLSNEQKFGFLLNDDKERPIVEMGPHLPQSVHGFAEAMGRIAASWASAEVHLSCYLAILMETSPERTFALLKPYRSARSTAEAAKELAKATLTGTALNDFVRLVERLNSAAEKRNRVQHDIWVRKGDDTDILHAVRALEYTQFRVRFSYILHHEISNADQQTKLIELAKAFADKVSNRYTVQRLNDILYEIDQVGIDLQKLVISRGAQ
jgi:hypothetical protein